MAQWVQAVGGQATIILSGQKKELKWKKSFNVRREIRNIADWSKQTELKERMRQREREEKEEREEVR